MPDLLVYALIGGIAFLVLIVVLAVVLGGLRPKRGPSSFSHDSHWDSNSGI
ncbi:MAG TPA: hypothetical protein VF533_09290 [Solirubrobacteraceae bacterium]|jgi:ABC-type transporter Mla subunit MlaD